MPRPRNERQALEEERADLPAQIAPAYQQDLAFTPVENKINALMAFVAECCGDLDGGRDGGRVGPAYSCGASIVQPVTSPPQAPART